MAFFSPIFFPLQHTYMFHAWDLVGRIARSDGETTGSVSRTFQTVQSALSWYVWVGYVESSTQRKGGSPNLVYRVGSLIGLRTNVNALSLNT